MWYTFSAYIKFLLSSSNQHGVHSPFVFELITKCFNSKIKYSEYEVLNQYRAKLYKNKNLISVTSFGAGSKIFRSNKRAVHKIAKNAGMSKKRAQLIFRIVNYFNSEKILELGTSLGLATSALSLGNENANIITIEGCPETVKVAQHYFDRFQLHNIDLRLNNFEDELSHLNESFDLIFVDGNHNKKATLEYFNTLMQHVHSNSIIIFDDIYWSKEMTTAWNIIKQHPKVTVSIDTFYWGIIFFRKEQTKEHFTLRM